jgi:thiol-disulfide isomerase/thioredoxin
MEDPKSVVFAFALQHGIVLFPVLALTLLALTVFLLTRQGRFRWGRRIVAGLCVALIVPCALAFYFTRSVNAALARRVGHFSFRLVSDDSEHRLSEYAGKMVVLNFWATWCAPCLKELPELEKLAERRPGEVVVLTVSDEAKDELRAAVPARTTRLNGYFGDVPPDDPIGKMAYQGRPTTLIIGRDGQIRDLLVGAHTLASFEAALARLR